MDMINVLFIEEMRISKNEMMTISGSVEHGNDLSENERCVFFFFFSLIILDICPVISLEFCIGYTQIQYGRNVGHWRAIVLLCFSPFNQAAVEIKKSNHQRTREMNM